MKHKIFIAINFSDNIKEKIISLKELEELSILPMSWDDKDNLHLTVAFLGFVNNESLYEVTQKLHEFAKDIDPFLLNLYKITTGPLNEKAKMIWLLGEKSDELKNLENKVKEIPLYVPIQNREKKYDFTPHVTLGKILKIEDDVKMPNKEIKLKVDISSIELMESVREKGKIRFITLEKINLGLQEY